MSARAARRSVFTAADDECIRRAWPHLAQVPGREPYQVASRAYRLGLRRPGSPARARRVRAMRRARTARGL